MLTRLGIVERNAREIDFGEFCLYLLFVADENDFANAFLRKNLCSLGSTNVIAFRKCNGFASKDNSDPDTRAWKQSQITYTDGLKAGDMVLVQKLNDNNKYVIIARVVEA